MALEETIAERVAALTLEDKVRLLTGEDAWSMYAIPEIGLRKLVMSDGPVGVRGVTWEESDTAANLPSPTAIAASWDEKLVYRLGQLLAAEARRKGVDMLLAPTVNLHRSPLGGRHFECYSEDPHLTSRIAVAYVQGLQDGGVSACVKHFVANDSETERMTYDAKVSERAMRELYLAPFEATVKDAGAWSVMAAYNAVDGYTMTESPLLDDILKDEWGFDGAVVSDWTATRSTVPTANAGLDLAMPGPIGPWGEALVAAVREGKVAESKIDEKVRRLLRLAARVGALEGFEAKPALVLSDAEVSSTIREAAAAGFVLARNENDVLPLNGSTLKKVAVLGPNAAEGRTQGGGSATVFPSYKVAPLEGIRQALGEGVEVVSTIGAKATEQLESVRPEGGVTVRYLAADGAELGSENKPVAQFFWLGSFMEGVPSDQVASIEATATITAQAGGAHAVGFAGVGQFALEVNGQRVFDEVIALPEGAEPFEGVMRPPYRKTTVQAEAGESLALKVVHTVGGHGAFGAFSLGHEEPGRSADDELAYAESLAAEADVAIVVVGTTAQIESEGFDRDSLALPGRQNELVSRVAAANPRTVVVVNSGSPVELPFLDSAGAGEVGAVLLSWFPGQEGGNALADVLLGIAEPGGRLPTTWPVVAEDSPVLSTKPADGVLEYSEGLHVGDRGWAKSGKAPRFEFGHGLGYTTWSYGEATVDGLTVSVPVTNTGARRGKTVVQVYAAKQDSKVERPVHWLVGFTTVEADPGETVATTIGIPQRSLEYWDNGWQLESGDYVLAVARSANVLETRAILTV